MKTVIQPIYGTRACEEPFRSKAEPVPESCKTGRVVFGGVIVGQETEED
jgi:hypothetical protein